MANMMDADAALSAARAKVEVFREKFLREWSAPYTATMARAQLLGVAQEIVNNPRLAAHYQKRMPAEFRQMETAVKGVKNA